MDKFEEKLEEKLIELNSCENRVMNSCNMCKDQFSCDLRQEYVEAVYKSMSKDKTGGFEF